MKYNEAQALNGVAQFHKTFNLPVLEAPEIPSSDRCKLRINLLEEELDELKDVICSMSYQGLSMNSALGQISVSFLKRCSVPI